MLKTVIICNEKSAEFYRVLFASQSGFSMLGFYNPDDPRNKDKNGQYLYIQDLIEIANAFILDKDIEADVNEIIISAIKNGKHLFFNGFQSFEPTVLSIYNNLAIESGSCLHIGNVKHNQPLFTAASQFVRKPAYLKLEKYTQAPNLQKFEKWFFENLSQELDLILRIANSSVRHLRVKPLQLFGQQPDLMNIHLEFHNDLNCHVSVGRAVEPNVNKLRIFQQNRILHLDFMEQKLVEYKKQDHSDQLQLLQNEAGNPNWDFAENVKDVMPFDAWKMELRNFEENLRLHLHPLTHVQHWIEVAQLAQEMHEKIERRYYAAG